MWQFDNLQVGIPGCDFPAYAACGAPHKAHHSELSEHANEPEEVWQALPHIVGVCRTDPRMVTEVPGHYIPQGR
jgi:hypothetical protein